MEFALYVVVYALGAAVIALCLIAIPGPPQPSAHAAASPNDHHPPAH
jgi:hypothetical protein